MEIQLKVTIHVHEGETVNPQVLARAVSRVITHATECDIEGAEVIDGRIGQVSATVANVWL